MNSVAAVLGFSWSYVRRYWVRLVASLLFGLIFALANASFMWAARTLASRWELSSASETRSGNPTKTKLPAAVGTLRAKAEEIGKQIEGKLDPWLPRTQQPMTWKHILGILLFLPTLVAIRAV